MKKLLITISLLIIVALIFKLLIPQPETAPTDTVTETPIIDVERVDEEPLNEETSTTNPLTQAEKRITKKSFGTYVTPENSPVQPERFEGFHTGTDFEIFSGEENSDIPFTAICDGKILQIRTASGYGGLLIQSCTIENQNVTVVYGHIDTKSIAKKVGDTLTQSERIGILGQPSSETDGERKHLHLSIHKGTTINILGYVPTQSQLQNWIDFMK